MPAYPITATAAVNAAGDGLDAIVRAIEHGLSGLGPCPELGDPPPCVGWLGSPPALPEHLHAHDARATRVLFASLAPIADAIEAACTRWGASRTGAVLAAPIADLDALAVALRLRASLPVPTSEALVELVLAATSVRGPVYACSAEGAAGAAAIATGVRLLEAGTLDAVIVGGCEVLGPAALRNPEAAAPGEGAALALLERHGDAYVELAAVSQVRAGSARAHLEQEPAQGANAYVHAIAALASDAGRSSAPLVDSTPVTGHLRAAAGATELVVAVASLERGRAPMLAAPRDADLESAIVDVPVHAGGRVALALRARSS